MSKHHEKKEHSVLPIYCFAGTWLLCVCIFPIYRGWALAVTAVLSLLVMYISMKLTEKRSQPKETKTEEPEPAHVKARSNKEISPEAQAILDEGHRAMGEMARIYSSVTDPQVRSKINEIMRITDKITQDAVEDENDIPQIKRFMNYYLPTTIKLLNAYDRMSSQGIEGENLAKSMNSINDMLDQAIAAYKKRLDSLFENQALDIETDIEVMNQMLAREGLSGEKDFDVKIYSKPQN